MTDDGHNYFFGQQPLMPWRRQQTQLESFIELIRDAEVGNMLDISEYASASDFTEIVFLQNGRGKYLWKAVARWSNRTINSRSKDLLKDSKISFLKKCGIPTDEVEL